MPYAPTVNDNSGQILAQGINQGVNNLAEGIQRSIAERKKKEEDRKAKEAVNAAGKGLFGEDFDVKDANPKDYGTLIQMWQERANKPLKDAQLLAAQTQQQNQALQMRNSQLEVERQQRDDAALQAALAGIDASGGQSSGPSVGLTENQTGMTGTQPVRGGATAADAADVFTIAAGKGASGAALGNLATIDARRAAATENRAQAAQRGMPKPSEQWATSPDGTPYVRTGAGNIQFQPTAPKLSKTEADEVIALVNALKQAQTSGDTPAAAALADAIKKRTTASSEMAQLVAAINNFRPGAAGEIPLLPKPSTATAPEPQDFSAFEGKRIKGPDGAIYLVKNGTPIKQ